MYHYIVQKVIAPEGENYTSSNKPVGKATFVIHLSRIIHEIFINDGKVSRLVIIDSFAETILREVQSDGTIKEWHYSTVGDLTDDISFGAVFNRTLREDLKYIY